MPREALSVRRACARSRVSPRHDDRDDGGGRRGGDEAGREGVGAPCGRGIGMDQRMSLACMHGRARGRTKGSSSNSGWTGSSPRPVGFGRSKRGRRPAARSRSAPITGAARGVWTQTTLSFENRDRMIGVDSFRSPCAPNHVAFD